MGFSGLSLEMKETKHLTGVLLVMSYAHICSFSGDEKLYIFPPVKSPKMLEGGRDRHYSKHMQNENDLMLIHVMSPE